MFEMDRGSIRTQRSACYDHWTLVNSTLSRASSVNGHGLFFAPAEVFSFLGSKQFNSEQNVVKNAANCANASNVSRRLNMQHGEGFDPHMCIHVSMQAC